jgi:hypothetical protein
VPVAAAPVVGVPVVGAVPAAPVVEAAPVVPEPVGDVPVPVDPALVEPALVAPVLAVLVPVVVAPVLAVVAAPDVAVDWAPAVWPGCEDVFVVEGAASSAAAMSVASCGAKPVGSGAWMSLSPALSWTRGWGATNVSRPGEGITMPIPVARRSIRWYSANPATPA